MWLDRLVDSDRSVIFYFAQSGGNQCVSLHRNHPGYLVAVVPGAIRLRAKDRRPGCSARHELMVD
jgi:hypothetical protein